ncbi:hypothetical protein GQS_09825 [Thermococcus sp. 4557]|uniref:hypothetical protein n=1 Tax=Thermococcus sp. (strain CGMCC 1.5172 / 4557) TaxID=1042877 RepID=UPI000219E9C5|nr:hypothetical protein [Thermococcus sp. 4557]AEK73859.1 hypothetical protein GQS_09825 [Thermococcus sp. 4557]
MRRVEIIVSFILIILITMSGGCINSPQGEKTESPVIETTHEGAGEYTSENTSPLEEAKATFPSGTFKPKRVDWFSYSPENSVSGVVSRISEKYNVTESPVDIPLPPRSLSSFTGTADGIEFGLFAYPNSTAVEGAMNDMVELLLENGFRRGDGNFWEKENESYTAFYTYERYFYVLFVARTAGGDSEERAMRLSEFTWSIITIGPNPGKVLGLFLPVDVVEESWMGEEGISFDGYLEAREGVIKGTGVKAVFLVYRPYEGREVYLQLKEAFLKNGWVGDEYVDTYTRNPAGSMVVGDYFEADGTGIYIELARIAGMERVTLLSGNPEEVKDIMDMLWEWDDPTEGLSFERGDDLPRGVFKPVSERSVRPGTVISMVLDDLRKDFNITTDFVDIPEVPAAAWYTGRAGDVEFMLLVYPNATAYLTALDELTEKLLAGGWERTDDGREPYARTFARDADEITVFVQYRYNHYLAVVVKKPRYSTSDFFWHVVGTGGTSPGALLSFGKLRNDVKPWDWTAREGLEFDGYIYKLEGNVSSGGARAAVLFYPYGLGREVYLQLKKAFLETGWVERDYAELPSHDARRHLAANDLFEKSGKAVYIEVSTYGDMDVLILLYGDRSGVKISAEAMWE